MARVDGVSIEGAVPAGARWVLSPDAVAFVAELHRRFDGRRLALLDARKARQSRLDAGALPTFLKETEWVRSGSWRCPPPPADLEERRVEITGPPDRKMVINALNSGANVFMADFEDSLAPTWENLLNGQVNLRDAIAGTISLESGGKRYKLKEKVATLLVRPRGWHLNEEHFRVDGAPVSGALFDFGLYFFHNAHRLLQNGSGPYFYLPKMESHREARLWNDVFVFSQSARGIPQGTIRATVLIETILAAFEMDEIIYELRDHSIGLNCGRWDYIFSLIKKLKEHKQFVLPDRDEVGMTRPFMDAYVRLLIQTCHRRGVHAMGGMAAQIPIKDNAEANAKAMAKVRADKLREVKAGHDGTWVAHPGLIEIAKKAFNEHMRGKNQLDVHPKYERPITAADLLDIGKGGSITRAGLRDNLDVGLRYVEAWLRGIGCVPIHNKMEDAATAEISRSQLWQWLHHGVSLSDGTRVTPGLISSELDAVVASIKSEQGAKFAQSKFDLAADVYRHLVLDAQIADFLTLVCYKYITTRAKPSRL
ncbi:Malate synthase [Plasmodiophora brassicae]|uniref:Malate synthase n=1 Tax=Plasmodiophora brassicae TaxID=37360 RepID=A0A0G4IYE3_PLABS|nr:hypothetical protein PBRA_007820 [Plasmodiophora brassicae]SPR00209.1 unnamed protein product [Plasmodiophora brassicae]